MSFNRNIYDSCSYNNLLKRDVGILGHVMDIKRYEHDRPCRHNFGFVGGNNVSHIDGNLVNLSSELMGITRYMSKCGNNMYLPRSDGIIKNDKTEDISIKPKHLKSCQTIGYQSVPLPYMPKEMIFYNL